MDNTSFLYLCVMGTMQLGVKRTSISCFPMVYSVNDGKNYPQEAWVSVIPLSLFVMFQSSLTKHGRSGGYRAPITQTLVVHFLCVKQQWWFLWQVKVLKISCAVKRLRTRNGVTQSLFMGPLSDCMMLLLHCQISFEKQGHKQIY